MKHYIQNNFLLMALAALCTFSSCNTDLCKDVDCGEHGECFEGGCVCDTGYEGDACATLTRDKFIGSYDLAETCDTGADTYTINVTAGSADDLSISFDNLYNVGIAVTATVVSGVTSITIASQTFGTGTISGSGTIDAATGVVSLAYVVDVGGQMDACAATLTPQ